MMKTKMDYIRHYRELYDNESITIDQYGNALRDISPFLNIIDMIKIEEMRKRGGR